MPNPHSYEHRRQNQAMSVCIKDVAGAVSPEKTRQMMCARMDGGKRDEGSEAIASMFSSASKPARTRKG